MPVVTKQIREAPHFRYRIVAVGERNAEGRLHCPTLEFFREAASAHPIELEKLSALLDFTAAEHLPRNEQKFKNLEGSNGIYEFKTTALRLLCFLDSEFLIVCAAGVVKKSRKTPSGVIETAENWKTLYFAAKAKNLLHHEPEHI